MAFQEANLSYDVRRSTRARRSRLTVNDEGRTIVVLPWRASEEDAADLVARHRRWIDRHVQRIAERRQQRESRPDLGRGRSILYRGGRYRVVSLASIDARARTSVKLVDDCIVVTSGALESRLLAAILESWFRNQARGEVERRVAARSAEMRIDPQRIAIRDQRTRWGSASRRGTLSFSWRLLMCPDEVLDYVVVHELAHLKVAGHSRSFWRLVDRHFPDTAGARRWLRDHHDEVRHALD